MTPEEQQEQAERDWFAQPMSAGFHDAQNTTFEFEDDEPSDKVQLKSAN